MSRRWLGSALLMAVTLLAAACSSSVSPAQGPLRLRADDPAVQVDSPQLRKLKAAAGIEDCPVSVDSPPPTAGGLPDITLPCLGGGRDVDMAGLRGTPLVLNFWSQTCGPCRAESPRFQQFHQAAGDKVRVVGIDWLDPRPAYAIGFADELGLTYPQVADPEGVTRAPLRITALPITILVSADGRVVHTEYGAVDSVNDLSEWVADHLGESIEVVRR
jgi:cytochrome c biogenesis protein CcmG, thiol:disulfide interchange protein DsbE